MTPERSLRASMWVVTIAAVLSLAATPLLASLAGEPQIDCQGLPSPEADTACIDSPSNRLAAVALLVTIQLLCVIATVSVSRAVTQSAVGYRALLACGVGAFAPVGSAVVLASTMDLAIGDAAALAMWSIASAVTCLVFSAMGIAVVAVQKLFAAIGVCAALAAAAINPAVAAPVLLAVGSVVGWFIAARGTTASQTARESTSVATSPASR
ncbi:hypothetical protein [Microcella alkaliphila]|nr:hypothetical protein [Microcella alkaliphila]